MRHYEDDARQQFDYRLTYNTPDGGEYTSLEPPIPPPLTQPSKESCTQGLLP